MAKCWEWGREVRHSDAERSYSDALLWKAKSDFSKLFLFVPFFSSDYARKKPNPIQRIFTLPSYSTSHSEAAECILGKPRAASSCEAVNVMRADALSRAFPGGKGFVPSSSCT